MRIPKPPLEARSKIHLDVTRGVVAFLMATYPSPTINQDGEYHSVSSPWETLESMADFLDGLLVGHLILAHRPESVRDFRIPTLRIFRN